MRFFTTYCVRWQALASYRFLPALQVSIKKHDRLPCAVLKSGDSDSMIKQISVKQLGCAQSETQPGLLAIASHVGDPPPAVHGPVHTSSGSWRTEPTWLALRGESDPKSQALDSTISRDPICFDRDLFDILHLCEGSK